MAVAAYAVGLTEAKANLNKIARRVNETGQPVTVFRRNKPYVTIIPAVEQFNDETLQAIEDLKDAPVYRSVDELFDSLGM